MDKENNSKKVTIKHCSKTSVITNQGNESETDKNEIYTKTDISSKREIISKVETKNKISESYLEKNFKTLKMENIKTENDFDSLPLETQLDIDNRSFCKFFWDNLKVKHNILTLFFYKSIISPLWIRLISLYLEISFEFSLNALFFSTDIIDKQAEKKLEEGFESVGFIYIITEEFMKTFWSVLISNLLCILLNFIIIVPSRYKSELNKHLVHNNKDKVSKGM